MALARNASQADRVMEHVRHTNWRTRRSLPENRRVLAVGAAIYSRPPENAR